MTIPIGPVLNVAKTIGAPLALKALTKLNPKFKNFFTEAAAYGYGADQALSYLTERFSKPNEFQNQLEKGEAQGTLRPDEAAAKQQINAQQIPGKILRSGAAFGGAGLLGAMGDQPAGDEQQPKQQGESESQQGNTGSLGFQQFINQHPELGQFLDQEMQRGSSPRNAGIKAKGLRKFKDTILGIETNIGQSFEDLLDYLFRGTNESPKNKMEGIGETLNIVKNASTPNRQKALAEKARAELNKKKILNG